MALGKAKASSKSAAFLARFETGVKDAEAEFAALELPVATISAPLCRLPASPENETYLCLAFAFSKSDNIRLAHYV